MIITHPLLYIVFVCCLLYSWEDDILGSAYVFFLLIYDIIKPEKQKAKGLAVFLK